MIKKCILLLLSLLLLTGCAPAESIPTEAPRQPETVAVPPAETLPPTSPPETAAPTEAPTLPPHSELYIDGLAAEDVILYFNEVCLDAEFVNAGNPSYLQKWISPISYFVSGIPTEDDLETLKRFTRWLNELDGFPGIVETGDVASANLRIYFCDEQELLDLMGDQFYGTDGAVTFWYADDIIYDAVICIRTDLDQQLRNSVILEEVYNGLGPVQDTDLRPDSLIYSGFSQPQELTEIDELILKLLYHPELKCGMDAAACEAVIRELYY